MIKIPVTPIEFFAIYNPTTLDVIGVYPSHAASDITHKISISQQLADMIFDGTIPLQHCFIDITSDVPVVAQHQSISKIDNILHRVPDRAYIQIDNPDLTILFDNTINQFTISISDRVKNLRWSTDINLRFLISAYNDPHILYQVINIELASLVSAPYTVTYTGPSKLFSVFTSRVFKTYIFENT